MRYSLVLSIIFHFHFSLIPLTHLFIMNGSLFLTVIKLELCLTPFLVSAVLFAKLSCYSLQIKDRKINNWFYLNLLVFKMPNTGTNSLRGDKFTLKFFWSNKKYFEGDIYICLMFWLITFALRLADIFNSISLTDWHPRVGSFLGIQSYEVTSLILVLLKFNVSVYVFVY